MIADYFTKPLQGMIFRKLLDMIMGNTDIVLPTDEPDNKPTGIPMVATPQESRSVLESDTGNDRSPRSLTVRRTCDTSGVPPVPRARALTTNIDSGAPTTSKPVQNKTLSWADVTRQRTKRVSKGSLFLRNLSQRRLISNPTVATLTGRCQGRH
jgi:hypothetical protein